MRENLISFENRIKNLELLSYKIAESSGINLKSFKKTINQNSIEHENSEVIQCHKVYFIAKNIR